MTENSLVRTGPTWIFGDNINTDLIFPNAAFRLPIEQHPKMVFSANRPGWVDQVNVGDLLIAGTDFGMGSGRPVGYLLGKCGIRGIVAESVNGMALRNCVNYGMPVMECRGVTSLFQEGEIARVDFRSGLVENVTSGKSLQGKPMPTLLADITQSGGVTEMLVSKGLIERVPTFMASR